IERDPPARALPRCTESGKSTPKTQLVPVRSVARPNISEHPEEDPMATVTSDIDIDAPVSTVYNQWTQFEDFPAFMSGVKEIHQLTDAELHWKVAVAGAEREFDARITEQ